MLLPEAGKPSDDVFRLAKFSVSQRTTRLVGTHLLAQAHYRAGQYQDALRTLGPERRAKAGDAFLRAMALHRFGKRDDARKWLDIGLKLCEQHLSEPLRMAGASTNLSLPWKSRLATRLMRREAEELILDKQGDE